LDYTLERLSPDLVYIEWHCVACENEAKRWVEDIRTVLKQSDVPQFFLSNLCNGYVTDAMVLLEHGRLTDHPYYGGGITYSDQQASGIYVNMADHLSNTEDIADYNDADAAILALEAMKPGITEDTHLQDLL